MSKLFVGGSRKITRLDATVKEGIDAFLNDEPNILIGDANGADKAVQQYLADKEYERVAVFCVNSFCRNNIGNWIVRTIPYPKKRVDFRGFAMRDEAMAREADRGLMLWDGESKGTVNNVLNLLSDGKSASVYLTLEKQFFEIHSFQDLRIMLANGDAEAIEKMNAQINLKKRLNATEQPLLF